MLKFPRVFCVYWQPYVNRYNNYVCNVAIDVQFDCPPEITNYSLREGVLHKETE